MSASRKVDMYISKVNCGPVICLLNSYIEIVRFSESLLLEVLIYFSERLMSAIEGLLCYVCMKGVC